MLQEAFRRKFISLVVLALHFLFLLMLLMRESVRPTVTHAERSSVLFFVDAPRPQVTPPPAVQSRSTPVTPSVIAAPNTSEQTSTAPSTPPNPSATIDWTAQATAAAAAVVDKAIQQETRKCDPSDSPDSFLPPCNPKTRQFEWNPEPPRVGFSGGLPYVRIGERCAVGLGFFGCGFGDLPPANGDLFEGMDDAERDRSSVPSPDPPDHRK